MALSNRDINDILEYIQMNRARIQTNAKLFDIYEGDLLRFVHEAMRDELHRQSYEQAVPRTSPININRRLVQKLSRLYAEPPERIAENVRDQELLEWYEDSMGIDLILKDCNVFFNNQRYCLLQPYLDPKTMKPKARAIPASRFLVRSTDRIDPSRPTEVILFMGKVGDSYEYWVYTDDSLTKILDDGTVLGVEENPYGRIPFVFITKSKYSVMPAPDEDLLQMSVLIPILLTDVNYATKFQAFSIIYGIDLDMDNMLLGPNNVWSFKSDAEKNIKPKIDVLNPDADIDSMIASIETQLSIFFESRNLKRSGRGRAGVETAQSGIALMIQNLDVTDDIKDQREVFLEAEDEFWDLVMNHMHPVWLPTMEGTKRRFTEDAKVIVEFPEIKPLSSEDETLEREIRKLDNGLTTRRLALMKMHPRKSEASINEMLEEIENEIELRPISLTQEQANGSTDEESTEE